MNYTIWENSLEDKYEKKNRSVKPLISCFLPYFLILMQISRQEKKHLKGIRVFSFVAEVPNQWMQ